MGTTEGHPCLQRDPRADPSVLPAEAAGVAPAGTRPAASEGPAEEAAPGAERGRAGPYRGPPEPVSAPGPPEPAPGGRSQRRVFPPAGSR